VQVATRSSEQEATSPQCSGLVPGHTETAWTVFMAAED
jgi:hypothetical protein